MDVDMEALEANADDIADSIIDHTTRKERKVMVELLKERLLKE